MRKWGIGGGAALLLLAVAVLLGRGLGRVAPRPWVKCVQIYYNRSSDPGYLYGRLHALFLQNLLGHFPMIQQYVQPIDTYRKGDLDRCQASFYLGTDYDVTIPPAFLEDYVQTSKTVVWAGYHIWQLPPEKLRALWSVSFQGLAGLDNEHRDFEGRPGYFRFFEYKGETFFKYGELGADRQTFQGPYELARLQGPTDASVTVDAWAYHSSTGERLPYALHRGNHWYIADSPFSYMHEEDRYLIFCDLLFDILGEPPRHPQKKPALIRMEDVHPRTPLPDLYRTVDLLSRMNIPFAISVIPIYYDPLRAETPPDEPNRLSAADSHPFRDFLSYADQHGATFLLHGSTHQLGQKKNPYTGVSGDDFEFWDSARQGPIEGDSAQLVTDHVRDSVDALKQAGFAASGWETPHYQASPLDYRTLAHLFSWNIGRVFYSPCGPTRDCSAQSSGQFFPYEIFGDVYDQQLIPEDLGDLQPALNEQVTHLRSVSDLLRAAKRNRVLRDVWASFFIHPSQVARAAAQTEGTQPDLETLLRELQVSGYEFVDLKKLTSESAGQPPHRPEPIENNNLQEKHP